MEEESSIYKSIEAEKTKENSNENIKLRNYFSINQENTNIENKNKNKNNISRLSQQPSKAQIYHYEKTIHDLSIKISDLNSQNEKLHLQIDKSKAIIDSFQNEIKILKDQLINQTDNNQNLLDKISHNELMIEELKDLNQKLINNNKIKFETLNKEINEKEEIINNINQQIKAKDETIKYYTINNNLSQRYSNNYKNELENQKIINKNLEQKISQLNAQIDNLYIQNQSEGSLLLQIENLKDDNIRLIQMLKSMKQAEDLEPLYIDSSSIKNIKIYKNNNKNNLLLNEALAYGIKLKQKFGLDISNTILKNFVAGMNQIWQDKYERDIKEIKRNYQKELDSFHSKPQNISKNQTQIINSISSDNISVNSINYNNNSNNIGKINNSKNNYMKNIINNNDYEKGCFWMIEKCDEEMNDLNNNIVELFQEYEEKLKKSLNDNNEDNFDYYFKIVNNCVKWFFSTLKSMINDLKNKMNDWENEIRKKCDI